MWPRCYKCVDSMGVTFNDEFVCVNEDCECFDPHADIKKDE